MFSISSYSTLTVLARCFSITCLLLWTFFRVLKGRPCLRVCFGFQNNNCVAGSLPRIIWPESLRRRRLIFWLRRGFPSYNSLMVICVLGLIFFTLFNIRVYAPSMLFSVDFVKDPGFTGVEQDRLNRYFGKCFAWCWKRCSISKLLPVN